MEAVDRLTSVFIGVCFCRRLEHVWVCLFILKVVGWAPVNSKIRDGTSEGTDILPEFGIFGRVTFDEHIDLFVVDRLVSMDSYG